MTMRPCGNCHGDGVVEVCPVGHSAGCDCAGRTICCPDCDGSGEEQADDDEDEGDETDATSST